MLPFGTHRCRPIRQHSANLRHHQWFAKLVEPGLPQPCPANYSSIDRDLAMKLAALLVLLAIPLLEIGLLAKVGQWLGFWPTLGIVVGTAFIGFSVLVNQGFKAPFRMQEAMLRGETPAATLMDGALMWMAGVLLMTPGLFADAMGIVLLVPIVRRAVSRWIASQFFGAFDIDVQVNSRRSTTGGSDGHREGRNSQGRPANDAPAANGPVIEGEFERLEERTIDPARSRSNGRNQN